MSTGSPPRIGSADPASARRTAERGYVVAQTGLLIIPLMIFAALATDIGYWYIQGQQTQRAVDAASLAGVTLLPDFDAAVAEARAVAARNGFLDATPNDNSDFLTGPLPQIEVTSPRSGALEVKVRNEERSFLGKIVLDSITVERFAVSEFVPPLYLGNPSSALGTGTIPESSLGVPPDLTWLSLNAYCTDIERGDHLMAGYTNGIADHTYSTCGPAVGSVLGGVTPNPHLDADAYVFVTETQPGTGLIDLQVFEPGGGCNDAPSAALDTGDSAGGPRIHYRVYGPSTSLNHRLFVENNTPIASGLFPINACYTNSPSGDGWWPVATGLASPADGGFYYVQIATQSPGLSGSVDALWAETGINFLAMKANRSGDPNACILSAADTTCPKLYALDWLPMFRDLDNTEDEFYLTEVIDSQEGSAMNIRVFDPADGAISLQFANPSGNSVPFTYRWADTSVLNFSGPGYRETSPTPATSTCDWGGVGGNPCLMTTPFADFNDHMLEITIDIPTNYTCGGNCWWTVRYTTGGGVGDRTNWSIDFVGDPVQLVE